MCGLAGYLETNGAAPQAEILAEFTRLMHHRGPDGHGHIIDGPVGLAHNRLSILDLSHAADQPMWDEERRACVAFNGEIYNFRAIRTELEGEGWRFRSTGDTEVLLKACLHWGVPAAAKKFDGMFGFAFWDAGRRNLWLARDRMGIKPLHYSWCGDRFVFASEIKPILTLRTPRPHLINLLAVLEGDAPFWGQNTLFQDVCSVEPGRWLCVSSDRQITAGSYFNLMDEVDPALYRELDRASTGSVIERMQTLLGQSVSLHMVSDAPVATLASGGLDSSLISALACKLSPGLHLYHADVVGPDSERWAAQILADHLHCPLTAEPLRPAEYVSWLGQVLYHNEYPSGYHPNDVPFYLVSRAAARSGIKVLLTGEGADELFHGYESMAVEMGQRSVSRLASTLTRMMANVPGIAKIPQLLPNLRRHGDHTMTRFGLDLSDRREAEEHYAFIARTPQREIMVEGAIYCHAHLRSLLHRNDRMGMMASVESRIPLLENEIIRFAVNLPPRFKIPRNPLLPGFSHPLRNNKWILRQVGRRLLPRSLFRRKKMGFPVTPMKYLNITPEYFTDGFIQETLQLSLSRWRRIWDVSSNDFRWNCFATEMWGRMFIHAQSPEIISAQIARLARTA